MFQQIVEIISWQSSEQDFKERSVFSQLEITILETDHYKLEHTYTQNSPSSYQNYFSRSVERDSTKHEVLRVKEKRNMVLFAKKTTG
ncbi:unnamed protein product [Parnassius apollo]|uniref:(apollo) hypothetical protein n=1 Tax=Parnassius apollo TaxID=110799 RepID=A0A8S3WIM8_PARAO|nr:unnamed protein product [Parnassius apollo]